MAEMTAQEAKNFIVKELKELSGTEGCCVQTMQINQDKRNNLRKLASLIEQQAATIDKKNAEINTLTQANAEMVLRLTIDAMRNLTSEQIDDVFRFVND